MPAVISVFGASTPQPGHEEYTQAYQLGRLLAVHGYDVATGGYSGTMTAVSQGAAEAGGKVIGVTSDQIERFRPLGPNRFVQEEVRYETLLDRLVHLVTRNDGIIVLPGGIGTLSEFALAWSFLQVGELSSRPLVLLGDLWRRTTAAFVRPLYVSANHLSLLQFASTPAEAVELLQRHV